MKTLIFFILIFCNYANSQIQQAFPNLPAFNMITELTHAGDGTNRLFCVEQTGKIFVFNNFDTASVRKTFLDFSDRVLVTQYTGLLGLAFHPNYELNRYFFINYTFDSAGMNWIRVSRLRANLLNPDIANPGSETVIHTLRWYDWVVAGTLRFSNEGYLHVSMGGDIFIYSADSSQNRYGLLGKIWRIDIDNPTQGRQYGIPPSNPYAAGGGRGEVFAIGLRNPWKFSIDRVTGIILAGDNGAVSWESIHNIVSGGNYGWPCMEGSHVFPLGWTLHDCESETFIPPIYEYPHTPVANGDGSVIGGFVYRGSLMSELYGKYIFGDFNSGRIFALDLVTRVCVTLADIPDEYTLSSFGEDQNSELYMCNYQDGKIYTLYGGSLPVPLTLRLQVIPQGLFSFANDELNARDTIRVYLRNAAAPYAIVDSAKEVIDSTGGSADFLFNNTLSGFYYIVVKHRNHIETWSGLGGKLLINSSYNEYSFAWAASQAYGNNLINVGGTYCVYGGDVNQDGVIDASDYLLVNNVALNFATGYVSSDLTGDGFVDASDLSIVDNNVLSIIQIQRP